MGGGPRRPREQAPVGGLADETIAAGPGGHERREGEAIHEQRAEHVPTLREVTEQDSAGVRRTLPQQVIDALAATFPTTTALRANFPYAFACPAAVLRDGELNMGCTEIMSPWGDAVPEGWGR